MSWIKLKNIFFILSINMLILVTILGILEISFRSIYPEFKGHTHSEKLTVGKKRHFANFYGFNIRSIKNQKEIKVDPEKELILVFGDSITGGYGHAYHDIWWKKLEELLKIRGLNYQFIPIGGFGYNFVDNIENILTLLEKNLLKNKKPKKIIYQFNFNDILHHRSSNLKQKISKQSLWSKFSKFRYEHLNKSVFLRVIQYYGGILIRKRSGSCEERKYDALGQYSYTYGSQFVSSDAELYWQSFENNISSSSQFLEREGIPFEIVVAPILHQIDKHRIHPYNFHLNLDFSCATIDPLERLKEITRNNNIVIYDPTIYLRDQFENRVNDDNFMRFYFVGDTNHFTPIASNYIGQFIAKNWADDVNK